MNDITAPRPPKKPSSTSHRFQKRKIGIEVSEELIQRALKVYEVDAKRLGMHGLALALGVSHAEALACIGQLRMRGQIKNDREVFVATVPHRGKAA